MIFLEYDVKEAPLRCENMVFPCKLDAFHPEVPFHDPIFFSFVGFNTVLQNSSFTMELH